MATRSMGPASGWHWLARGINLGAHNPRALFGAGALVMLVALVPSLLQVLAMLATDNDPQAVLWAMVAGMAALVVVFPLLVAGFLRVIHAIEQGRPTRAMAVFDTFRAGEGRGRIIAVGLLTMLAYLAMLALVVVLAGRDVAAWYMDVLVISQSAAPDASVAPGALPALPDGFGLVLALVFVVMMVSTGLYAIAFGQVALAGRGVGESFGDAAAGTFKNVLPLLVLMICGGVTMVVAMIVVGLVVALLAVLGALAHPVLGMVLAMPVYLAFLVMIYVVMFGILYAIWRDVCGADAPAADDSAVAA